MTTTDDASSGVAALYAASYTRLVRVLAVSAGSVGEAEECVQEAFVRLLREWPKVRNYEDPEGWVRAVAFRVASNRLRRARNATKAVLRLTPRSTAFSSDARLDVERALMRLSLGQRQVLVLHYLLGLDVAAIATELNISAGTVKSRLSRGRAALEPLLHSEGQYVGH